MATKKAAAKKGSGGTTALAKWDEKFAKYAKEGKEQVKNLGVGGIGISFGRGKIEVGGNAVPGGKLECIIIGSCALNAWYESDYNPNDKQPPDCYALAVVSDDPEMKPHPSCTNKQAELCSECDKNKFGTAKTGRGKACGNNIRIGCITAKDAEDAASISSAELATGKVSPTNLVHFKKYLESIEEQHGRPLWAVVTEISSHDDPKTQIRLEFKLVELIDDDEILAALEKRFLTIQDVLQKPFAAPIERDAAPAKGKTSAGGSKKFAGNGKKR